MVGLGPPVSFEISTWNLSIKKGLQQKNLAEMPWIHKVSLYRYEKDISRPDYQTLPKLKNIIGHINP